MPSTTAFEELVSRLAGSGALVSTTRVVPKCDHLYNWGDANDGIYILVAGLVKTTAYSCDGKPCLLSIYAPGNVFGELSLTAAERTETAIAMKTAVVHKIAAADMFASLADRSMVKSFIDHLLVRQWQKQQIIANFVTLESEQRLAAALLFLARELGERRGALLSIRERITQEELSQMIGTTRSRVGYFLKRFREAGLIAHESAGSISIDERRFVDYVGDVIPSCDTVRQRVMNPIAR